MHSGSLGTRIVDLLGPVPRGHAAPAAAGDVRLMRRQRRADDDPGDDDDDRQTAAVVRRHGQAPAPRHLLPRTPVARGMPRESGERLQRRGQCTVIETIRVFNFSMCFALIKRQNSDAAVLRKWEN